MVYRRLEARGEIRGGRFLAGVTGEQFALPEAVARLRAIRRRDDKPGQMVTISAADTLNQIGIVTPGERIASIRSSRILFEDGVPLAVLEAGKVRPLTDYPVERDAAIAAKLSRTGSRVTAKAEGPKQAHRIATGAARPRDD
jgi:ATP-dependent Lhr-like helicase